MTWNCRGSSRTDSAASTISASQAPWSKLAGACSSRAASGTARARSSSGPGPPNSANTTYRPTARKATSLTTLSAAMAATMPSWRSAVSRWRVPKAMVKPASASATYSVLSVHQGPSCAAPTPVVSAMPLAIALSCSAT